jgi:hypothetical protein
MRTLLRRSAYSSLLATVAAVAIASSAQAGLVDTPASPIGEDGVFGINAAGSTVTYNTTTGTLTVTIDTYYAGAPGLGGGGSPSYGTGYGSLFLSSNGYSNSNFAYNYAVTTPYGNSGAPVSTNSASQTATGLYAVGTLGGALPSNVQSQTFTTTKGTLVGSNVNGANGGPGGYIWGNGIVQYTPGGTETKTLSASVYVTPDSGPVTDPVNFPLGNTEGSITYTILNANSLFGNGSIGLYWAMTCANEAVSGTITPQILTGTGQSNAPIPAALPLFVSGLGVMGFFGSRRKKRMAQASAA